MIVQAYELLRSDLVTGRIRPGAKLNVTRMAAELGFSLGAVRESLSRLTAEGLVEAEPQRGFRASPVSLEDLDDLVEARALVLGACARQAVERGDVAWESRIVAAHHALSRTGITRGLEKWEVLHDEFHDALLAACTNRYLRHMCDALYVRGSRYRYLAIPLAGPKGRDVKGEHRDLMESALSRDPKGFAEALVAHNDRTTAAVREWLLENGDLVEPGER